MKKPDEGSGESTMKSKKQPSSPEMKPPELEPSASSQNPQKYPIFNPIKKFP